ncbi:MAG: glutathione S-transferase family protein [Hyphomicrobiaceae bacterium]|nr:glutathione S-transferase family protein [Hyphomicrobiaceae bacterium]
MSDVTLIGPEFSTYVRSARIACVEKGITHDLNTDHLSGPESLNSDAHLAYHPFGRIPVLLHDDFRLFETSAICRYVDATFDGPPLVPTERRQAALMEQWISAYNDYVSPVVLRRHILPYAFPQGPDGAPDREVIDAGLPEVANMLKILNAALETGPFFLGQTPTIADFFLLPAIDYLRTTPEGPDLLAAAPNVARHRDAFTERKSYSQTLPERLRETA